MALVLIILTLEGVYTMSKIETVSRWLRVSIQITMLLYVAGFIVSWVAIIIGYTPMGSNAGARFTLALISTSAIVLILYFLVKLFRAYENNDIFTVGNAKLIRNIGYVLLGKQFLSPLLYFIIHDAVLILPSIEKIGLAAIIIIHSWITIEAYHLKEQQSLTV